MGGYNNGHVILRKHVFSRWFFGDRKVNSISFIKKIIMIWSFHMNSIWSVTASRSIGHISNIINQSVRIVHESLFRIM